VGAAASAAEAIKVAKYSELLTNHQFLPVAVCVKIPRRKKISELLQSSNLEGILFQGSETLERKYVFCRNMLNYRHFNTKRMTPSNSGLPYLQVTIDIHVGLPSHDLKK